MNRDNSTLSNERSTRSLLVVEDNPGDVRLIKEALAEINLPWDLTVSRDGQSALEILGLAGESDQILLPDLILLDLNLPRVNGREVLQTLKNDPDRRSIPTVIFSTSGADSDIRQCYQQQANCYITKPSDFGKYLQVIQELFDFWSTTAIIPLKTT